MTTWVRRLLYANIAVFFLQMTTGDAFTGLFDFVPALILIRPWTIVTYMFLHGSITHILFNMIALYFFGPRVEQRLGSARFIRLYFISGIVGALLSFAFAPGSPIIGASAGIFGVMLAFATFWPRDQILIWGILPIEARWLVVITTGLALYSGFGGSRGGVADFAHLGGYVGAFVYLRWIARRPELQKFRKRVAGEVPDRALRNWQHVDTKSIHAINKEEVDRILDKINASGLGSLTPQEKLFLSNFVPPDDRIPPAS